MKPQHRNIAHSWNFSHQNKTHSVLQYTFSGKEKDSETGYSYFGARYYDSGMSVWLSVDPLSDKYPSQSPYSYVGNRPTMVIDPNGMNEWIPPTEAGGDWTAQKGDSPGSLARDAGISQSEAESVMRNHNTGKNRSSDIMVYTGDKVSIPESGIENSTQTNTSQTVSANTNTTTIQSTYTPPPLATGRCDYSPINVESFFFGAVAVVKAITRFFISESDITIINQGAKPKSSPNFKAPTNPAQLPPKKVPQGYRVRIGKPTEQYPNGYWRLEKPMQQGGWQGINPSTMRPGALHETHVPIPAGYWKI